MGAALPLEIGIIRYGADRPASWLLLVIPIFLAQADQVETTAKPVPPAIHFTQDSVTRSDVPK
jgi:hypothetical protein